MRPPRTEYRVLEEGASTGDRGAHDFELEGAHERLVSAFAWHPLLRRAMPIPSLWLLIGLWVAAAIGRMRLPVPVPWGDEAFTLRLASGSYEALLTALARDLHPPLYFSIAWLIAQVSGPSLEAIRFWGYLIAALPLGLLPLTIRAWPHNYRLFATMALLVWLLVPWDLYFVMARYYGLLALLLAAGLVWLGNSLEEIPAREAGRWSALSVSVFVLACLTNYQSYLVWGVALVFAWRQGGKDGRRNSGPQHVLGMIVVFALTALWFKVGAGESPLGALTEAHASPFETGIVNLAAELGARVGVIVLTWLHSEFTPLWWPPLFFIIGAVLYFRGTRYAQSDLSPTAQLCGGTAVAMALAMAILTATVIPVGVEFLPARLCYLFVPASLAGAEWLLRRKAHLRGFAILGLLNLAVLIGGADAASRAIQGPSPSTPAPFLHATYLNPVRAAWQVMANTTEDRKLTLLVDDPASGLAILGWDLHQPESERVLYPVTSMIGSTAAPWMPSGSDLWVYTSTRDLSPSGERAAWEAYLAEHGTLVESWEFLREDPLWLRLKQVGLRREVAVYKKQLRRYRIR